MVGVLTVRPGVGGLKKISGDPQSEAHPLLLGRWLSEHAVSVGVGPTFKTLWDRRQPAPLLGWESEMYRKL